MASLLRVRRARRRRKPSRFAKRPSDAAKSTAALFIYASRSSNAFRSPNTSSKLNRVSEQSENVTRQPLGGNVTAGSSVIVSVTGY
jgi:hypothetical protein